MNTGIEYDRRANWTRMKSLRTSCFEHDEAWLALAL